MGVQTEEFIRCTVKEFEVALRDMIENNHAVHLFTIGKKDGTEYGLLIMTGKRAALDDFLDAQRDFAQHKGIVA